MNNTKLTDNKINNRYAERNCGIDLLRLVAMFMVVNLHVMGRGGVLSATTGYKHLAVCLLETAAYCASDCYAIISGFVSYSETEKPYRYSKFLSFWLQIITYSFGITVIAFILRPEAIGIRAVIKSLFPVTTGAYWYVTAYAGVFFIIPWMNKLLRSCSNKEASCLIAVVSTVFIAYSTFANYCGDCFKLAEGYSFAWLAILYLIGAWMKKCNIPGQLKSSYLLIGSGLCILFTWAVHKITSGLFLKYTSITVVFVAFTLVAVFSKLKIKPVLSKIIACFAPAAFGVYLIHVQPLIWDYGINSAFEWIAEFSTCLVPFLVLGSAFCIFAVCLLIEKLRLILFELLKINKFADFVEKKIDRLSERSVERLIDK